MTIDTPSLPQSDQLQAAVRDLTEANGLEVTDRIGIDPAWLDTASAAELLDVLVQRTLDATAAGELLSMVAIGLGDDAVSFALLTLKREAT